jgi:hypothetical protein
MESVSSSVAPAPRQTGDNGGFPSPTAGQAVRLVRARHDACGETTLIRVPRALTSRAIRLVACGHCGQEFEPGPVSDLGVLSPARPTGKAHAEAAPAPLPTPAGSARPTLPEWWKAPVALAAVIGGLLLIQSLDGGVSSSPIAQTANRSAAVAAATQSPAAAETKASPDARLVKGTNYTIALPAGWKATSPSGGATFSASAADGSADATLWVRNDPQLDFPTFEASSLAQLRSLAGAAHVAQRVSAPTPAATVVRLAADAPQGQPGYEVTLRLSGPYRYYLSTTLQPGASADATKGVELLSNSLTPVAAGASALGGGK